jgi:hypothetical protein
MYIGLHVKYHLFLSDLNETSNFSAEFGKYSNIKFHENPSSGSRVVPCGRTDRERQKDKQNHRRTEKRDEVNSSFAVLPTFLRNLHFAHCGFV